MKKGLSPEQRKGEEAGSSLRMEALFFWMK